jgi:hypothetical protein
MVHNGMRRCKLGTLGASVTGFLAGFGIGLPAAKEFGSFSLTGRVLIAVVFGVVGLVGGFLAGLAQFCTG